MKRLVLIYLIGVFPLCAMAQGGKTSSLEIDKISDKLKLYLQNDKKDSAYSLIVSTDKRCKGTCSDLYNIYNFYGYYYEYLNDFTNAALYYSKSLKIKKNQFEILTRRGLAYYNTQNYDLSQKDFRACMALKPEVPFSYYSLSLIYAYSPQMKLDSSMYYIDKALSLDSLDESFLTHKVDLLFDQENCMEALGYEIKLLEVKEDKGLIDILQLSDIFICLHKEEDALTMLEGYDSIAESEQVMEKISYIYSVQERFDKAIFWFEKILSKYPENISTMLDLVGVKYRIGEKEEAKRRLQQFIVSTNGNPQLYDLQADIYRSESNGEAALESINQAIKKSADPSYLIKRAKIEIELNSYSKAFDDYLTVFSKDSCNLEALDFCGKYCVMEKKFSDAIKYAKQSQRCGYKIELLDVLVQSYFYEGKYDLVRANIDAWLSNDQKNESAIFIKAMMEACYGDKDKAITLCKMLRSNVSRQNAESVRVLLSLLYLISNDMGSFYREMDQVASLNKELFKKNVAFEKKKSKEEVSRIKIAKGENYDFLLTVVIAEEQLNEIKNKYGF